MIYPKPDFMPATYTILNFSVPDIDAAVDGLARRTREAGGDLRKLQSGRLFDYLRDAVLGAAAVAALVAVSSLL
jgi:hypothetical protein